MSMMEKLENNENINRSSNLANEMSFEPKSVLDEEEEEFFDYSEDLKEIKETRDSWAPLNFSTNENLDVVDDVGEKSDFYPEWEALDIKKTDSLEENEIINGSDKINYEPLIADDKSKLENDDEEIVIDTSFEPLEKRTELIDEESLDIDKLMFNEKMIDELSSSEELVDEEIESDSITDTNDNDDIDESSLDDETIMIDSEIFENFKKIDMMDEEKEEDTDLTEKYIDESLLINEVTEFNEELLKPFANLEKITEQKIESVNLSDEGSNYQSSVKALESLALITNYAILANGLDEISVEDFGNINSYIEDKEHEYARLLDEKKEQVVKQKIRVNLTKEITDLFAGKNNISNYVSPYNIQLEEYEKILSEYNKEKDNYDQACEDFKNLIETDEFNNNPIFTEEISEFINQGYPENRIQYVLNKYRKNSDSSDKLVEGLKKISKAKWNVEAYQEYIDVFYSEDYIDSLKEKISYFEKDLQSIDEFEKARERYVLDTFDGAYMDKEGNISYNVEESDYELINEKHKLDSLKGNVRFLANNIKVHPAKLGEEIKELIENNGDKELIESKLSLLLKYVHTDKIEGSFTSDEKNFNNIEEDIIKFTNERCEKEKLLNELKQQHDSESYKNDFSYIEDTLKLQKYISKDKELDLEIARVKAIYNRGKNFKKFTIANIVIKIKENEKNKLAKKKKTLLKTNENNANQEEIAKIDIKIKIINKIINKYRQDRIKYSRDIYMAKGFANKNKLDELVKAKEKNQKLITRMTNEINDKEKNYGYIDQELKISLEEDIESLNIQIDTLEKIKKNMNVKTVDELANNILNYDKKIGKKNVLEKIEEFKQANNLTMTDDNSINMTDDNSINKDNEEEVIELEEIDNFKEPKKGLLDKIKSIDFKKIASKAITKITMAVATIAMGVGIISGFHSVKTNDAVVKDDEVSEMNNTNEIVQESDDYKDESIEEEINQVVNKEDNNIEITVSKPEETTDVKEEEKVVVEDNKIGNASDNDFVNTSKISTTLNESANNDYIPQEQISESSFQNENIKRFEYFEKDGQLIRRIYAKDGTVEGIPIGFENVSDHITTGKTR